MKSRPKPRNMKEIERLEEQKPHRKHFIVVVNRPYTSTINTQQLKRHAQSVQNKEITLQCVNARLFIQLKRKYRVKPVIQMIAIFPDRSAATKAKRNGL